MVQLIQTSMFIKQKKKSPKFVKSHNGHHQVCWIGKLGNLLFFLFNDWLIEQPNWSGAAAQLSPQPWLTPLNIYIYIYVTAYLRFWGVVGATLKSFPLHQLTTLFYFAGILGGLVGELIQTCNALAVAQIFRGFLRWRKWKNKGRLSL